MENINELYSDIVERAKATGIANQEAWDDLVEEVVEEYRTNGLLDDDDPTEGMEDVLRGRFGEYHEAVMQDEEKLG
jgi:hypothetical protein